MELLFPLLILALLVPMFLGVRRQKREMAKTVELQDSLTVGDRVLTTSGLHGLVDGLTETTVDLEIAPGIITTWSRAVVREVLADTDDDEDQAGAEDQADAGYENAASETTAAVEAPFLEADHRSADNGATGQPKLTKE